MEAIEVNNVLVDGAIVSRSSTRTPELKIHVSLTECLLLNLREVRLIIYRAPQYDRRTSLSITRDQLFICL